MKAKSAEIAARCHEVQTGLGSTNVPEFDNVTLIGMAVRLALHIRGLPAISFEIVKLVGYHFLGIPTLAIKQVLELLAEIEFVRLGTEGKTIKTVLPDVPYYEELYNELGDYAIYNGFNEAEELTLELMQKLSRAPHKMDTLRNELGVDKFLFKRAIEVGQEGSYFRICRARGRDVLLTPTYFSENPELFADAVAGAGSDQVAKLLEAIKGAQGYPLALIEKSKKIGGIDVSDEEIRLLTRLAQEGAVKPPSIQTEHAGENYFLFTPTPSGAALSPTKRDIYEKAMAIVAAIRQGQFLPRRYAIKSPGAVLYTLRRDLKLGKATTEATQQYRNLVRLRVAQLVDVGHGYSELRIIDTEENLEALTIAYTLVDAGIAAGTEIDSDARNALQQDQEYVESLVSSAKLKKSRQVPLSEHQQEQLEMIFLQ